MNNSVAIDKITVHYVEAFDHTELLERWVLLLAPLPHITLVCHVKPQYVDWLAQRLSAHPDVDIRCPRRGEGWRTYLQRLSFSSNSRVIVATLGRRPQWFCSLSGRVRFYLVLHNLNYCFDRREFRLPVRGIKDLMRDGLDHLRKRGKRRLFASAAGLLYPYQRMALEGRRQPFLAVTKHHVMPFAGRHERSRQDKEAITDGYLRVVVPGTVTNRTRDYDLVLEALRRAASANAKLNVFFAGRVSDPQIVEQLRLSIPDLSATRESATIQLHHYPEGLSESAFIALLSTADVLLAPMRPEIQVGRYRELLGITKASGTPFDATFFGKPLLLPAWHPLENPAVVNFTNGTELGDLLVEFAAQRNFPTDCWSDCSEGMLQERWSQVLTG